MARSGLAEACVASLRKRNASTSLPFQDLIRDHAQLLTDSASLQQSNSGLKAKLEAAEAEVAMLRKASSDAGIGVGKCPKCSDMQDELLTSMRESAKDKQQILELKEQVKGLQSKERVLTDDVEAANARAKTFEDSISVLRTELEERGNALEVSISECASRTVEVERQRAEIMQLKRENGELLERLITMKETEAEKYNEIHNMLAEAEKKKQAADVYKPGSAPRGSSGLSAGMMSDVLTSGGGGIQIKSCIPSAPKHSIVAHERSEVHSLAHNTSGSMLLTSSDDRTVKMWDSRTGTKMSSLEGAVKAVMCVAFSNDGNSILGASGDFAVRIWSLKTCRVLHTLTGHTGKIYTAGFMPDSQMAFSSGYDRYIKIWDLTKGLVSKTMLCTSSCNDAAVSRDGWMLSSVHLDASIRFWDARTGEFAHELAGAHSQPITSVCYNPMNESQIITNSRDDTVSIIDVRKYDTVLKMKHHSYKNGVNWNRACISPDGSYIAAGGADGVIYIWDAVTGNIAKTLSGGHKSAVVACSWGDNDQLASIEKEHRLVLWE